MTKNMQVIQKVLPGETFGKTGSLCDKPQPFTNPNNRVVSDIKAK